MGLKLDYDHEEKVLYSDNTLVGRIKWGNYYLGIYITENQASLTRYCVPGRIDSYSFSYVPDHIGGIGNRVTFFTDTHLSLKQALIQVQRDLKKKHVKELLQQAKFKCPRSYLGTLLESLR